MQTSEPESPLARPRRDMCGLLWLYHSMNRSTGSLLRIIITLNSDSLCWISPCSRLAVVFYGLVEYGQGVFSRGMLKYAISSNKTGCVILVAQEPPTVLKQLVVRMPHGVGVRALKANPLAPPALFLILGCEILVSQHLVYGTAWNIYSNSYLYYPTQAYDTQMIPCSGCKHCMVFPASWKIIFRQIHGGMINNLTCTGVPVPARSFLTQRAEMFMVLAMLDTIRSHVFRHKICAGLNDPCLDVSWT